MVNKKMVAGLAILLVILLIGIIITNKMNPNSTENYSYPAPEEVVREYFLSWNNEDYANTYATLSDGFKKMDSNAQDLSTFKNFVSSQGIKGINTISIDEVSNDGTTATVKYTVEFLLSDGSTKQLSDKFTLKLKNGDIIPGWKLIHPYGKNIDTS